MGDNTFLEAHTHTATEAQSPPPALGERMEKGTCTCVEHLSTEGYSHSVKNSLPDIRVGETII